MDEDKIIKKLEEEAAKDPKIKGQVIKHGKVIPLSPENVKLIKMQKRRN